MPTSLSIVENGQRSTRNVALFWKERRVLVEVVKHDVMLDFAWKDLLRVCPHSEAERRRARQRWVARSRQLCQLCR
jgi:hypothetical protein